MPQRLALTIGINYAGGPSELRGCLADARHWSGALAARGFEVQTLLEKDATKANIIDATKSLVSRLGHCDVGFVTFSGHGTFVADAEGGDEADGRDEAWVPCDYAGGNLLTDDEVFDLHDDRHRTSRLVVVSDSCHSGTVSRFAAEPEPEPGPYRAVRFLPPTRDWLPKKLVPHVGGPPRTARRAKTPALLLSGCRDWEYSYDANIDGIAQGAASWAYLAALKEGPKTYRDWAKLMPARLPTRQYPQTPCLLGTKSQQRWPVPA